jgi:hypothetical protein
VINIKSSGVGCLTWLFQGLPVYSEKSPGKMGTPDIEKDASEF